MADFKVGDYVKLINTGESYSLWNSNGYDRHKFFLLYVQRYKPINVIIENNLAFSSIKIKSGFYSSEDLARFNYQWKIKFILYINLATTYYLISSNHNHMLIVNKKAIEYEKTT